MAFGLIQWLISFIIFLVVLTVITWSAVHLGKKDQNSPNVITKLFDVDDSIERNNTSFHPTIMHNSTSQVIANTEDPILFASDQGSEIPNSVEFYKILQTFLPTKNNAVTSMENDTTTAIFTSFVVGNDSWDKDITTTVYNISEKSLALINPQNISGKAMQLPNHTLQIINSTMVHGARFFDMDRLQKSDSYRSEGTEFFLQDERNETSNASPVFSFVQVLPDVKRSNMT